MPIVLAVDDSASVIEIIQVVLSAEGFRVIPASNGERAVQVLHKRAVDLIITDLYMPDFDGLELIGSARAICPQTPIVAMSGKTGAMNMLRTAALLGACATLPKPFTPAELLAAVHQVLGVAGNRRASSRELHSGDVPVGGA